MTIKLAFTVTWMIIIFIGSSVPGNDVPGLPTPDYMLHALEYAILGWLIAWCCTDQKMTILNNKKVDTWSWLYKAVLIGSFYGITDEFHQSFIPGRCADPKDWLADTIGCLVGSLLFLAWLSYKKRKYAEKDY